MQKHCVLLLACMSILSCLILPSPVSAEFRKTTGPHGENPTPATSLILTEAQEAKLRSGNFTVALVWHESSDWAKAANQGARDEFARLGIKVVAQTDANFDAAKQKS